MQMFLKIYAEKRQEYLKYRERLSTGILKLDESYELVGKMQQELVELAPELERKTEVREGPLPPENPFPIKSFLRGLKLCLCPA